MERKRLRREARGEPAERNPAAALVDHEFLAQQNDNYFNNWSAFGADDHITYDLPRRLPDSDSEFSFVNDNGYLEDDEMYLPRMERKRLRREARGEPAERNPAAGLVSHEFLSQHHMIHDPMFANRFNHYPNQNDVAEANDAGVEDVGASAAVAVPTNNQLPPPVDIDDNFAPHGYGREGVWWWASI
jgi:hypothetical protein